MKKRTLYFLITTVLLAAYGCEQDQEKTEEVVETVAEKPKEEKRQFPNALKNGKIFTKDGVKYMYGGEDTTEHFDISNSILKDENFHFGIGREKFHALIEPEFISLEEADTIFCRFCKIFSFEY